MSVFICLLAVQTLSLKQWLYANMEFIMLLINSDNEVLDTSKKGGMYNIYKLYKFLGIEKAVDNRVAKYFSRHKILELFFEYGVNFQRHTYTKYHIHSDSDYVEIWTSIPHYEFVEYCKEYEDVFQCFWAGVEWTAPLVATSGRVDLRHHHLILLSDEQKEIPKLHQELVNLCRYVDYRFQHSKLK